MRIRKSAGEITKRIKERIYQGEFMERHRTSAKHFTRKRKLPFASLILFMLNLIKRTLQNELTQFIQKFSTKYDNITKSAFSQSRLKLKPEAFIELNDVLIEEFYTDNDLLNELIIDANIRHYDTGEYGLALKHIPKCSAKDLLIFDRGFGAIWFICYLLSNNLNFIIRVQKNFIMEVDEFLKSKEKSEVITIEKCHRKSENRLRKLGLVFKPFKVRLIKVQLDDGEIEVLITSLIDNKRYPNSIFKDLYFKRWGIEINIDHLKNNINIENFTGLSEQAIKQDFYANAFINNLQSIIARDSQPAINETKKSAEYKYKVNRNLSLGYMKDRIVKILTSNNPEYMEELKKLFEIEPVPIREGRKNPRNFHKLRRKFNMNNRGAV